MQYPIYLDYNATTPLDPEVLKVYYKALQHSFANAASRGYSLAEQVRQETEIARQTIANFIHTTPESIIFTSGATESINLALKGAAHIYRSRGKHLITQATEHKAVLDTYQALECEGFKITTLPVNNMGLVDVDALAHAITDETILVSIMHANNETGVIQPINEIGKITKERGVILHVDAAQSCGKIDVNVEEMQADLLSFSAHKMYGPKGIGALFVRKKNPYIRLEPCMHGGGHEHSMRSGTLNVPGVLAFAKACEVAQAAIKEEKQKLFNLQSFFWQKIQRELSDVALNGHPSKRLPNTLNISFGYVEGEAALKGINEKVAVSSGSACSSAVVETSYVLKAMQVPTPYAHTAIRFSLGRFTTQEEVSEAAEHVIKVIKELRKSSPIYQVRQQGIQGGFFAKYEEVRS